MRQFVAFTKKEFRESTATFRAYILLTVFLLLGMMSPLFAKLTPDILNSLGDMGQGITIQMPDPTALDAWAQFFKNVSQMGMLVLVIIFSGIMSNEFSRGTLVNLLTKGLSRKTVILSKFLTAGLLWTAAYLLCLGVCFAYTAYFFDIGGISYALLVFISPWLFGELLLALLIFGGTLFGNIYGSLLTCFAAVVALNILSIAPKAAKYNPVSLASGTLSILYGAGGPSDFVPALIICAAATIALIIVSILIFDKKTI